MNKHINRFTNLFYFSFFTAYNKPQVKENTSSQKKQKQDTRTATGNINRKL